MVDSNGNTVGNYNGPVTLSDTAIGTELVDASGNEVTSVAADATNGVATFTLQAGTAAGVTDTLTATASNNGASLTSGTTTVATVAQVATSVGLSFTTKSLEANTAGATAAVQAVVNDQAGNPMLSGSYGINFAISGPGILSGATTAVASSKLCCLVNAPA